MARRALRMLLEPWLRFEGYLGQMLSGPRPFARLAAVAVVGFLLWLLYVPLHELAHAGACVSCGGTVERMTLAPMYGGRIAERQFDWIDSDTPYAGQLAEFTTGGSDLCYLWLVLAPYMATPLARPLFRRAGRKRSAAAFAGGLLLAFVPLMSIPGDFYEAASIIVTEVAGSAVADAEALRSDDLTALVETLLAPGAGTPAAAWVLVAVAALLGTVGALAFTAWALPAPSPEQKGPEAGR